MPQKMSGKNEVQKFEQKNSTGGGGRVVQAILSQTALHEKPFQCLYLTK